MKLKNENEKLSRDMQKQNKTALNHVSFRQDIETPNKHNFLKN